ncbi:hypothetical protein JXD20_02940 [Candidatus Peregrinibacteria bacterium]|nr:hypothetical protein [Candidatus Peregrinibacteria bacterium]
MNGDLMPIGGHKRKADPAHAKAIKEGGKKAQEIARKTTKEHKQVEVPKAEEELLKDLQAVNNPDLNKIKK